MNFKTVNNITGGVVCLIACITYLLTAEAGGSFWDCGEFVSCCFKVQIPHPPGAPLFVLLGRLFIIVFGDHPLNAAKAVNCMSALASGFTILFLFWTITHMARKIVLRNTGALFINTMQTIAIMGAGAVGALAFTFSDSFWFSAVEGEVYAMSSFFTALVFWCICKWEERADEPQADRWIVFIFFLIGMSIGVHLLSLLDIPAIVMVYYFRRKERFRYALVKKYFLRVVGIGGILATLGALLVVQRDTPEGQSFDGTVAGLVFLGTLFVIGALYLLEWIGKKQKEQFGGVYIFLLAGCVLELFVQIGVIQYSVKTAGNFDLFFVNVLGFPFFWGFVFFFLLVAAGVWAALRYAKRKQWTLLTLGLWCMVFILFGYSPYATTMIRSNADPGVDVFNVDNPMNLYGYLGREQYGDFPLLYGQKFTARPLDYKDGSVKYGKGNHGKYVETGKEEHPIYAQEDQMIFPRMWDATNDQLHADYYAQYMGARKQKDGSYDSSPGFSDNLSFFLRYQNYYMYWRYFLWNFSGRQNDVEGLFADNVRDGNWITGIPFIDPIFYGNQAALPDTLKRNKAHNQLFALPLVLGLIGMFYHFKKNPGHAIAVMMLFLVTGIGIVLYINQPGMQPRERDYAYVGSFYAFAIWIGIGVLYFTNKALQQKRYGKPLAIGAVALLLGIPALMAQQEWDDHDRSKKQLARDMARNYLESCPPNAILFTYADNDTYPLWYAQEVEGIRPDVRVVITTLISADWCINQLRYKINQSAPIDVIWSKDQILGDKRNVAVIQPQPAYPQNRYYDLYDVMKNYLGDDSHLDNRGYVNLPVTRFSVPVNEQLVRTNGTVNAADSVEKEMRFEITKRYLVKNDLAILNIIAANHWKRPICFAGPYGDLGFGDYLRKEGMIYHLVPVLRSPVNTDRSLDIALHYFSSGNAQAPGVYFDEENRRQLNILRRAMAEIALDLCAKNREQDAIKVLERADVLMNEQNFPYGLSSRNNDHNRQSMYFLEACLQAGDTRLIQKVTVSLKKDLQEQIRYYQQLSPVQSDALQYDWQEANQMLEALNKLKT
jgi:hypothetical protein